MSNGVFTESLRFKFVDGEMSDTPSTGFVACGDGRPFCLEVVAPTIKDKFDIIAEIFYRGKDAQFTSGYARLEDESYVEFHAPTTVTSNRALGDLAVGGEVVRGYTTPVELGGVVIPAAYEQFFLAAYDRGDGQEFRDIADNENGQWIGGNVTELPYFWNWEYATYTAATFSSGITTPTDLYTLLDTDYFQADKAGAIVSCGGSVKFNGQIGVVKVNPTDSLFASTNRFFIGFDLTVISPDFDLVNNFWFSTLKHDWDLGIYPEGKNVICCDYELHLSGSRQLSCPIYGVTAYDFPYGTMFSGSNFIQEFTEWWPFSKNFPPSFVWDSTDGSLL